MVSVYTSARKMRPIVLYVRQFMPTITASDFSLSADLKHLSFKMNGEWKEAESTNRAAEGEMTVHRCGTLIVRNNLTIKMPAKTTGFPPGQNPFDVAIMDSVPKAELEKECAQDGYEFKYSPNTIKTL